MAATVDLNNSNQVLVNENEGRNMVNDNDKSLIKAAVVNKATKFDDATFAASVHVEKALLHDLYQKLVVDGSIFKNFVIEHGAFKGVKFDLDFVDLSVVTSDYYADEELYTWEQYQAFHDDEEHELYTSATTSMLFKFPKVLVDLGDDLGLYANLKFTTAAKSTKQGLLSLVVLRQVDAKNKDYQDTVVHTLHDGSAVFTYVDPLSLDLDKLHQAIAFLGMGYYDYEERVSMQDSPYSLYNSGGVYCGFNLRPYTDRSKSKSLIDENFLKFTDSSYRQDYINEHLRWFKAALIGDFEMVTDFEVNDGKYQVFDKEQLAYVCTDEKVALDKIDTSKINEMPLLFEFLNKRQDFTGINTWDVSNVEDMSGLFYKSNFNGDISSWDVSKVQSMQGMFEGSAFTGDISHWNTSNVQNMSAMFKDSVFNGDISSWDVSKVENMHSMFYHSKFTGDVSSWNVANVTTMNSMFFNTSFNGDLSKWQVSKVQDMCLMFYKTPFNGDISSWDVSKVKYMSAMFALSKFTGDISKWDVSHVQTMDEMFLGSWFDGDISAWNVSKVHDMRKMFRNSKFNGDISSWDVSNVRNMEEMFCGSKFKGDISKWQVYHNTHVSGMFNDSVFAGDLSSWCIRYSESDTFKRSDVPEDKRPKQFSR